MSDYNTGGPLDGLDSANSSTANLAGGATFTGAASRAVEYAGIQVTLKADRSCTVSIEQSQDATNWDVVDLYPYNKTIGTFGLTVQVVSSYWRVQVTNLNASTATTVFRLQSKLVSTVQAVPRSLDSYGNMKTAVQSLGDLSGDLADISAIGELGGYTNYRLAGKSFGAANDPNFWTLANSGTGSAATEANGIVTVTSGTANSGYGQLASVRLARFIASIQNKFRALLRVTTVTVADCVRRWGAYNVTGVNVPSNGFYFELSGAGVLSVNTVAGGVITSVASGSFNGPAQDFYTLDTNAHSYEIRYFVAKAVFYIDGIVIHTFTPTTTRMTEQLDLKIHALAINSASGTTSGTLEVWLNVITRLGLAASEPVYAHISGLAATWVLKNGAGLLRKIIFNNTSGTSVTIYDNTAASGDVIGIVTTASGAIGVWDYQVPFYTGLTIETTGNSLDATIVYE